jgi:hypothetical protein
MGIYSRTHAIVRPPSGASRSAGCYANVNRQAIIIKENHMKEKMKDIFWLPSIVLFFIGVLDVIRGFMHTFLLTWSAANIAKFNMATAPKDQIFLLGVFGISNFLTGFIYFLISRKAKELSPYVLIIIPLTYLFALIGIWSGGVHGQAAFEGKYFMLVYFGICIITFISFQFQKVSNKNPASR